MIHWPNGSLLKHIMLVPHIIWEYRGMDTHTLYMSSRIMYIIVCNSYASRYGNWKRQKASLLWYGNDLKRSSMMLALCNMLQVLMQNLPSPIDHHFCRVHAKQCKLYHTSRCTEHHKSKDTTSYGVHHALLLANGHRGDAHMYLLPAASWKLLSNKRQIKGSCIHMAQHHVVADQRFPKWPTCRWCALLRSRNIPGAFILFLMLRMHKVYLQYTTSTWGYNLHV